MKSLIHFIGLSLIISLFTFCEVEVPELNLDSRSTYFTPLDPNESPDRLCQELGLNVGELLTGKLPESTSGNQINISHFQTSAELSPGTTIYLPLNYTTANSGNIAGVYLHIEGSDHYWKIPIAKIGESTTQSKHSRVNNTYSSIVIPINLPDYVTPGSFNLIYSLFDQQGKISESASTQASVKAASEGCSFSAKGEEGLYTKRIILGNDPGTITVKHTMYSIPDRMDIRYNGKWVASTASSPLLPNEFPPSSICYDGTEGYVSGYRTYTINYDPSVSKYVDIYMYGCFESSTAWDFWVSCEPIEKGCCEDTPSPPTFSPKTVTFPADHEGKLKTGVVVNKGDYVFLGTKSTITIDRLALPVGADGTELWSPDKYKKYQNYELGQLIAWNGEEDYGFNSIRLGENECKQIIGDAIGTAYLFYGENGTFFKAKYSGEILLELNDNDPSNNEREFSVEIYVLKSEDHFGRNKYNCCPNQEPSGQDPCSHNWESDNEDSAECYHGGLDTYRGSGSRVNRSQCTYKDGVIFNEGGIMGTFDYGEPRTRLHMILDVFPHIVLGDAYQSTPVKNIY
ncbi:hypothetical protein [uncultured Cyclobacterium sp.]|uniref:hypothetical protein n=1 Tax=uncultured Cyclobacterium sp. TaxID=453820 RepID=UPI0030ED01A0